MLGSCVLKFRKQICVGDCATDVVNLAGECLAPSLAGLKLLEQPELQVDLMWCKALSFRVKIWKMIGPPASGNLRPKSVFLKEVLGTPVQTALAHTSP